MPHIQHRLTLLRTFRDRLLEPRGLDGDLHRCCKDSALISIRLFVEALGLGVDQEKGRMKKRDARAKRGDDIWFEDIGGTSVELDELTDEEHKLLIGMCKRADKELAHLTRTQDSECNRREKVFAAITLIERLVDDHFYRCLGATMPCTHDDRSPVDANW